MCIFQWAMARANWWSTIKFRAFPRGCDQTKPHMGNSRRLGWWSNMTNIDFQKRLCLGFESNSVDVNGCESNLALETHGPKSQLSAIWRRGPGIRLHQRPWSSMILEGCTLLWCRSGMIRFHTNFTKVPIIYIYIYIYIYIIIIS